MRRFTFALWILWFVPVSTGCRMCASPYDYCGPTYGVEQCGGECGGCGGCGGCGVACSMTDRQGSILGHGGDYAAYSNSPYAGDAEGEAYDTYDEPMDDAGADDEMDTQELPRDAEELPAEAMRRGPVDRGAARPGPGSIRGNNGTGRLRPVPDPRMSRRPASGPYGPGRTMVR